MTQTHEQALERDHLSAGRLRGALRAMRSAFSRTQPGVAPDAVDAGTQLIFTQIAPERAPESLEPDAPTVARVLGVKVTHGAFLCGAVAASCFVVFGALSLYQYQHDRYLLVRAEQAREMGAQALLLVSTVENGKGASSESRTTAEHMAMAFASLAEEQSGGFLGATAPFEREALLFNGVRRAWNRVHEAFGKMEEMSTQQRDRADAELRLHLASTAFVEAADLEVQAETKSLVAETVAAIADGKGSFTGDRLTQWALRQKFDLALATDLVNALENYRRKSRNLDASEKLEAELFESAMNLSNRLRVYAEAATLEHEADLEDALPLLASGWTLFLISALGSLAGVVLWWRGKALREQQHARMEAERAEVDRKRYTRQEDETMEALMVFNDMADGDFTQRFAVTDTPIGTLKSAANIMIEHVRDALTIAQSSSNQLEDRFAQIEHVFRFLRQVEMHQKQTAERSAGVANKLDGGMVVLVENANVTREAVRTVHERTATGVQAITDTLESMGAIRSGIQDTNKRMKKLGESIQEIMKIAEVLQRMADQANVLAMNTALQASQVNDRRMTVLAEEVGKLSENLSLSMQSIGTMGQEIGADARDTIASMERSVQFVVEGTRQVDSVRHALAAIMEASVDVTGAEQQMQGVIEAQRADTKMMGRLATHSLSLAERMGESAGKLDMNVVQMRADVAQLTSKLTEFKV